MKALRYLGPNELKVMQVEKPQPAAGEVLIRVKSCGICGSDVHGYMGLTGRRTPPMTMGHEFSGVVETVGEGVQTLVPGDRVAPYPVDYCGSCAQCRAGKTNVCSSKRQFGVLSVDGAFADYICVPAHLCFKLTEKVSFEEASMMEPLAVAYHAVQMAGDLRGKRVMIVGAGTIGLLVLVCCLVQKPDFVLVSDLSEERLKLAKKMGADATYHPPGGEESPKDYDVAIEAVGAGPSVRSAMDSLRIGGKAIWVGNNKPMIEINMQQIVTRELSVQGSFLYDLGDFEAAVKLINEGIVDLSPMLSKTIGLEEAPEWFERLARDPGSLIKVVVNP